MMLGPPGIAKGACTFVDRAGSGRSRRLLASHAAGLAADIQANLKFALILRRSMAGGGTSWNNGGGAGYLAAKLYIDDPQA